MRFLLGLLLGYSIRGKKPLLVATLTAIAFVAFVCFIVLPAIALIPVPESLSYKAALVYRSQWKPHG